MKNACIVGYGTIDSVHAKTIELASDANFYAVCDVDDNKLTEENIGETDIAL